MTQHDSDAEPTVIDASVIVPAYRAEATLSRCVEALLSQHYEGSYEVIVAACADTPADLPHLPAHPRLTVLGTPYRVSSAQGRNHGAGHARGRMLVFTDADAFAKPDWLERLTVAAAHGCAVAGAIANGTPGSAIGTAEYFVEFLEFHPGRPPEGIWHGATCNLLVPRPVWSRFGPFRDDVGGSEDTALTIQVQRAGLLMFEPRAQVRHRNRTGLGETVRHQYVLGGFAARVGRHTDHPLRPLLAFSPLAPVAAAGRMVSVYVRVARWLPRELPRVVALLPLVLVMLAAWGAGLAAEGARLDILRLARGRRNR